MKKTSLVLLLWGIMMMAFYPGFSRAEDNCDVVCQQMRELIGKESVVSVKVIGPGGIGYGTGNVVSYEDNRFILTNNHVVGSALKIWVKSPQCGPFMYEVEKVSRDPGMDLALLTVPAECSGIAPVKFADSVQVGERIYAVGHPFSMRTVTEGRVNATESDSWLYLVVQAPLNPGNSGGPLFNEKGELAGVNTGIRSGANLIGFTLPARHAQKMLPRLAKEKLVRHASAGFALRDLSNVLPYFFEQQGLGYPPKEDRVVVAGFQRNSPADQAGLKPFDIVEKFNGEAVKNAKELEMKIFFDHRPGEEATFTLRRGAQTFERKLLLSEFTSMFQNQEGDNQ